MSRRISRRKVLQGGLKSSLVVLGGSTQMLPGSIRALWARAAKVESAGGDTKVLSGVERENLKAAADEIIPAVDDMPAASEIGAVAYIDVVLADEADLRKQIQDALTKLEHSSQARHNRFFAKLGSAERIKLLEDFEKKATEASLADGNPNLFAALRDMVYEAYYTNPKIWPKIGYRFYATNEAGPDMKPFDESILANVRKMPKFYREVP